MHIAAETEGQNLSLTDPEHLTSKLKIPYRGSHVSYRKHGTPSSLLLKVVNHACQCEVATTVPGWLRANDDTHFDSVCKLGDLKMHSKNSCTNNKIRETGNRTCMTEMQKLVSG